MLKSFFSNKKDHFYQFLKFTFIFVFLLFSFFFWLGGYWENLPLLNKISGIKRFKQYVVDPIPDSISSLEGGYSGFPQGVIKTNFKFSGLIEQLAFLKKWRLVHEKEGNYKFQATHIFEKKVEKENQEQSIIRLFFDTQKNIGFLLVQ